MNPVQQMCSTKAKRQALVDEIVALGAAHGATLEPDNMPSLYGNHAIHFTLMLGPYRVAMYFDAHEHVNAWLAHWFTDLQSVATYPHDFCNAISGTINTSHWRKATTCAYTWPDFLSSLERGFIALNQHLTLDPVPVYQQGLITTAA